MADGGGFVDVVTRYTAFDAAFHPTRAGALAAALVDGSVELHDVGGSPGSPGARPRLLGRFAPHADSVRALRFSDDGGRLFTASADGSVAAADARGAPAWRAAAAHGGAALNALALYSTGGGAEHALLVTGDEDGGVRLWDVRAPGGGGSGGGAPAGVLAGGGGGSGGGGGGGAHGDVITDILPAPERHAVVVTSGDGSLSVWDARRPGRPLGRSEPGDEELLSAALLKGGGTLVTGCTSGLLLEWAWGAWGPAGEDGAGGPGRFPGHPASVAALAAVDGDTLATGSEDGLVRLVTVAPSTLVGVVGEHGPEGLPVERLAWAPGRAALASVGHDERVRVFDTRYLFEDDDEDDGDEGGDDDDGGGGGGGGGAAADAGGRGGAARRGGAAGGAGAAARGGGRSRFTSVPSLAAAAAAAGAGDGGEGDDDDDDDEDDEGDDDEDMGGVSAAPPPPRRGGAGKRGGGGGGGGAGARGGRGGGPKRGGGGGGAGGARGFFADL